MKINAKSSIQENPYFSTINKHGESGLFDVTKGAYDGAEVYELVGSFLLYQLSSKYNNKTSVSIEMTVWQFSKTKVHKKSK